jgi:hypothetical protein
MATEPLVLTYCPDPDCFAPAEIADDYVSDSTCGPVRHRITVCVNRHRYHLLGDDE